MINARFPLDLTPDFPLRFVEVVAEKEMELKRMFGDIEEATKLSTFWEKECNDLKAAKVKEVRI